MTRTLPSLLFSGLFLIGLLFAVQLKFLPQVLVFWYLGASAATFVAYGWDKYSATKNGWRTPERSLHLLSVVGGWPGGLLGRSVWRHKTQKQPFTAIFWLSIALNLLALLSLLTPLGVTLLSTIRRLVN